jgi:hypothetical protein
MNVIVGKNKRRDVIVYVVLRTLVIIMMILQILNKNFENVFLCVLTLILFMIPIWVDQKLNIKLPSMLEIIIFLFIFAAEILGEVAKFYVYFKHWDTILHTLNGFLCAAIGFSLIDILNRSERFHIKLSPIFVTMIAFCFSMTVGVLWEFFEFGMDTFFNKDMQKDELVSKISSVTLDESNSNKEVVIDNIEKTVIYSKNADGDEQIVEINGGYLDIGIRDTINDLFVNFLGAYTFSIIGWLYIKNRDKYKFAENFMPTRKTEEEIQQTQAELERLEHIIELKKKRKKALKLKKKLERGKFIKKIFKNDNQKKKK